jgi:hypothetical protein
VEDAAGEAKGLLPDHARGFHELSPAAGGLSSVSGSINLSGGEMKPGGKQKTIFPPAEKMASYRERYATGFPHWSKLQHRAP